MLMRCTVETPTGPITLTEDDGEIVSVQWEQGTQADQTPILQEAKAQIEAYFAHGLQVFTLPLHINGSETQRKICAAMSDIPFGETVTYGDLAKQLSLPAQAVGGGCGRNPIPLIVPCHRVLGAKGLGGFSGGTGIETKVALLRHEGAASLLI